MDIRTPLRLATALLGEKGRQHYRAAFRRRLWRGLGHLPWELRMHCELGKALSIRVSTRDQVICREVFATGEWESESLKFIRSYVRPGMVVADVGANIGVHTLTLAQCVGPDGSVHSFEPSPIVETLRHNVQENAYSSWVRVNACALGAVSGTLPFLECKPGSELFTSRGTPMVADAWTGNFVEYPVTSLDSYTAELGINRIHLVKVDVEGSENDVLRGASRLLKRGAIDCLMCELNDLCLQNCSSSVDELMGRLQSAGYRAYSLNGEGDLESLPQSLAGACYNVVAIHPNSRASGLA